MAKIIYNLFSLLLYLSLTLPVSLCLYLPISHSFDDNSGNGTKERLELGVRSIFYTIYQQMDLFPQKNCGNSMKNQVFLLSTITGKPPFALFQFIIFIIIHIIRRCRRPTHVQINAAPLLRLFLLLLLVFFNPCRRFLFSLE